MRLVFALIFTVVSWGAQACTGRVVGVTDGDTIKVLCGRTEVKVRLAQIDTPERGQAFGSRAKEALSDLIYGRDVRLDIETRDRYGRSVATVWRGALDVNREMVRKGYAWAYLKYLNDESLIKDEAEARRARLGLWVDTSPVPPWEFRRSTRSRGQ